MKKTGELRQPEGLNHTELMNVMSDGVREAMKDIPEPEPAPIEQANAALGLQPSPSDYLTQLNEMREAMTQIQQMFLATKQQDLQQPTMPQQSVQQHATKLTIFRQVTHPPNPQQPSTQVPIPPLPAPKPVHPTIPPIPHNFPASLPRVAPIPRVVPIPRVISPAPWYTYTPHIHGTQPWF